MVCIADQSQTANIDYVVGMLNPIGLNAQNTLQKRIL